MFETAFVCYRLWASTRDTIKIHSWNNRKYHRRLEAGESKRSIAEDLKVAQASLHVTTVKFTNTCKFTSVN
jgi:hypothetical protein